MANDNFFSGICYLTVKAGVAVRHFENSYSQGNSDDSYPNTCILLCINNPFNRFLYNNNNSMNYVIYTSI